MVVGCLGDDLIELEHGLNIGDGGKDMEGVLSY